MTLAHFQAVATVLDSALSATVYTEGVPENAALPYVVIWSRGGTIKAGDITGHPDGWRNIEFQTTVVAAGAKAAIRLQDLVYDALLGVSPSVSGWTCGPIWHVVGGTVDENERVPRVTWSPFDVWRLKTVPA